MGAGNNQHKTALIIGAGPAGLTAAYELASRSSIRPIVIESSPWLGGMARTVEHHGNRMDIGGHRFFSKSRRVMEWWSRQLPVQALPPQDADLEEFARDFVSPSKPRPNPEMEDEVMLICRRKSRILFAGRFFDYPLAISPQFFVNLGPRRSVRIIASYLRAALRPLWPERTLEDLFINRFGRELYSTFFKSYSEKVWGLPCHELSAEWGRQRIKGLSAAASVKHMLARRQGKAALSRSGETSLAECFLYPKFGPGQLWDRVAEEIRRLGGEILLNERASTIFISEGRVAALETAHSLRGAGQRFENPDFIISSMPLKDLFEALLPAPPAEVLGLAAGLQYRHFLTVGLLARKTGIRTHILQQGSLQDNWIYIQEPEVRLGRVQVFNNWSEYLVKDPKSTVWLGLEFFSDDTDPLWHAPDQEAAAAAVSELVKIGLLNRDAVLDHCVLHAPRAYPVYSGSYSGIDRIAEYISGIGNLFVAGRNGMHRYNNQDHSMLTAMAVADQIICGRLDHAAVWNINTDSEYQEEAQRPKR